MISVETDDEHAPYVHALVDLHRENKVKVALTTVSASESLRGSKEFPASAEAFRSRLKALDWEDLELLFAPMVLDMTYWGMSKIVGDGEAFEREIEAIWSVLGGTTSRRLPENLPAEELWSKRWKKWRNVWCDVHTLWTHIDADRDVFVTTNTSDFQNKFNELRGLRLREVKTPREMLAGLAQ